MTKGGSCRRTVTPAFLRALFHEVLSEVIGFAGLYFLTFPKGKTKFSGKAGPTFASYQALYSARTCIRALFMGMVLPVPASVFDFPTVRICLKKSICFQFRCLISASRMVVFSPKTIAG